MEPSSIQLSDTLAEDVKEGLPCAFHGKGVEVGGADFLGVFVRTQNEGDHGIIIPKGTPKCKIRVAESVIEGDSLSPSNASGFKHTKTGTARAIALENCKLGTGETSRVINGALIPNDSYSSSSKTADFNVTDDYTTVSGVSATVDATLLTANVDAKTKFTVEVTNIDNAVTLVTEGTETVNGEASLVLAIGRYYITCDGENWFAEMV